MYIYIYIYIYIYELFNLSETELLIKITCFREIFRAASADSLFASAGHFCNMSHVGNHVGSHVGIMLGDVVLGVGRMYLTKVANLTQTNPCCDQ